MSVTDARIEALCSVTKAEYVREALQECRSDCPENAYSHRKWRNAAWAVSDNMGEFTVADIEWVQAQARFEENTEY